MHTEHGGILSIRLENEGGRAGGGGVMGIRFPAISRLGRYHSNCYEITV